MHKVPCNTGTFIIALDKGYINMNTEKTILDKLPEQIFNELTANMDKNVKYDYVKFMYDTVFAKGKTMWSIVAFLYAVFHIYSPLPAQLLNNGKTCACDALYNISPLSSDYRKLPRYLHGVINKTTGGYRHPFNKQYIIKPARGQSKQFADQCLKIGSLLNSFQKMVVLPVHGSSHLIKIVSDVYNEMLQLVSMSKVSLTPENLRKRDIMRTGSVQMLNEYNMYASGTVANAVAARQEITDDRKSKTEKVRQMLHDMNSKELNCLSQRHDAELTNITVFDDFQNMLRQHEQERMDLLAKQHARTQAFQNSLDKSKQKALQERKYERLNAQLKLARITRMR